MATVIDDSDPRFAWFGSTWSTTHSDDRLKASYSDGTFHTATKDGDYCIIRWQGTDISVYGARRSNHGIYGVRIDGGTAQYYSGFSDTAQFNQTLFATSGLSQGTHELKLSNENARNTAQYPTYIWFDIDWVSIDGELLDANPDSAVVTTTTSQTTSATITTTSTSTSSSTTTQATSTTTSSSSPTTSSTASSDPSSSTTSSTSTHPMSKSTTSSVGELNSIKQYTLTSDTTVKPTSTGEPDIPTTAAAAVSNVSQSSDSKSSNKTTVVAVSVTVIIIAAVVIATIAGLWWWRRKKRQTEREEEGEQDYLASRPMQMAW